MSPSFLQATLALATLLSIHIDTVLAQENATTTTTTAAPPSTVPDVVVSEKERCGEIIDMHLHLAPWFSDATGLLDELDASLVDRGVLYSVYGPITFPGQKDPNEEVSEISLDSGGRIVGLASCNTTHPDWNATKDEELKRLSTYLNRAEFVGGKLAPPHTCLPLDGDRVVDVVQTVSESNSPVLAIHVGTTPFCGPLGAMVGLNACCQREYVAPSLLSPLIEQYPDVTFLLLHAGHDFLPPTDENYYNGTLTDEAIVLAQEFSNVYLEISALHAEDDPLLEDNFRYPGGLETIKKIVDAGLTDRIIWGSDANHGEGNLVQAMKESFEDMIEAGMSDEERCVSLADTSRMLFGLDDIPVDGPKSDEPTVSPAPSAVATSGMPTYNPTTPESDSVAEPAPVADQPSAAIILELNPSFALLAAFIGCAGFLC